MRTFREKGESRKSLVTKVALVVLGSIFLFIGFIGVILPVLPTTPFVFLALLCFMKGSDRLHKWLLNTSLYKKRVAPMIKRKGMTVRAKLSILLPVLGVLTLVFVLLENPVLRIVIVALAVTKTIVFIKIKTIRATEERELSRRC